MRIKPSRLVNLSHIKLNDYPKAAPVGKYLAQVVKVYDGDTITVVFRKHRFAPYYQYNVRMYGYDSPELRPSKKIDTIKRLQIKKFAKDARDYLRELILEKQVIIDIISNDDKYGRLLCTVYAHPNLDITRNVMTEDFTINVNSKMLDNGHGYEYYGGKKNDLG